MEDRVIHRQDGKHRYIIFRRGDGFFQVREDFLSYDEDDDVSYWSSVSNTHSGVYETIELAAMYVFTQPGYRDQISS